MTKPNITIGALVKVKGRDVSARLGINHHLRGFQAQVVGISEGPTTEYRLQVLRNGKIRYAYGEQLILHRPSKTSPRGRGARGPSCLATSYPRRHRGRSRP